LLIGTGKPRKTCVEVAGSRTFRILTSSQQSGIWRKKQQCPHSTENTHKMTIHTRQLQRYTRSTNNNYTQDNLKLASKHTRQIRIHVQKEYNMYNTYKLPCDYLTESHFVTVLTGFHCHDWASFVCDVTSPVSVQLINTMSQGPITGPFLGLYNIKSTCWEDQSRIWFHDENQICARAVLSFIPQLSKQGVCINRGFCWQSTVNITCAPQWSMYLSPQKIY